jgi:tetratricopeptide (TPR) repeat protein
MKDDYEWIHYGLGMVNIKRRRFKQAIDIFSEILKHKPKHPGACVQLGIINQLKNENEAAALLFKQALTYDIHHEPANYLLGLLCAENLRFEDAEMHLTKVMEVNPDHIDAIINLGLVCARKGDFLRAEELINFAYAKDEKITDGFAKIGSIKAETRDWLGALELMIKDHENGRLSSDWQIQLALMHGRMDDFKTSVKLIEKAYSYNKFVKNGFAQLGWIKADNRNWENAHEIMKLDLVKGRMSPPWKVNFAIVEACLRRWNEAMFLISDAYEEDAALHDGFSILGYHGYLFGKGKEFFKEQIDKDKALGRLAIEITLHRVLYIVSSGSIQEALEIVEAIYQRDLRKMGWLTNMGWLCVRMGKTEIGCELMERDFSLGRMEKVWLPSYAVTLSMCGKTNRALGVLSEILTDKPENSLLVIGYRSYPDALLSAMKLRAFIEKEIENKDLKCLKDISESYEPYSIS